MKKILVLAGSNRSASFNVALAATAAKNLALQGADVTRISLLDYPIPLYDEDLKSNEGISKNVIKLANIITTQQAIFIASPEYNGSISPLLKNMIDWVSVIRSKDGKPWAPWKGKIIALSAASPGNLGGVRGLAHLRDVFINLDCQVISEQTLIPNAAQAFDADGSIHDERSAKSLEKTCQSLFRFSTFNTMA